MTRSKLFSLLALLMAAHTANAQTPTEINIAGLQIDNLGSANLGLDGDIVPWGGSGLAYDLGNNTATEHWDDVVASEFLTFSDRDLKKNITRLTSGLAELLLLNPVSFQYIDQVDFDGRTRFGLIAQEVEEVLPGFVIREDVDRDPDTGEVIRTPSAYGAINYMQLIPVLIAGIQEQQQIIGLLESRIRLLEMEYGVKGSEQNLRGLELD